MPPPRYRVIERGRRLVVIDRRAGQVPPPPAAAAAAHVSPRAAPSRWGSPERIRFDGTAQLATARWYDDKGPRLVKLGAGRVRSIRVLKAALVFAAALILAGAVAWPGLLGLLLSPVVLANDDVRRRLRGAATGWLDRAAADWV